ncbi:hypothetical protein ATL41_2609 [Flavimobilis soli]|uniref:Secreted protein n=1 Tax=Flavimobilis soli TaxID=442709 RepID=A0A2A9EHU3_9MICO|nr:hypothetical protein [Flavimobilis soli]PFG37829.1 hypothetical protein ATL41_2609 [Flavimobilis soli]
MTIALGTSGGIAAASPVPVAAPLGQSVAHDAGATTHGRVRVATDEYGSTITWRYEDDLPLGDARPEFFAHGASLGAPTKVGSVMRLRVSGVTDLHASDVAVMASGRLLDGPASAGAAGARASVGSVAAGSAGSTAGAKTATPAVKAPAKVLSTDPGKPGKLKTKSFSYKLPSVKVQGYGAKVEMKGHVVMPVGARGERPVVVFLHGRHATCYAKGEVTGDWPCVAPAKAIPSHLGYVYAQKLLASQGYVTVSISANGINGQDWQDADGGAKARGELVRRHLDVLADWQVGKGSGPAERKKLKGAMNLRKVMTVGHSRGGEGVVRAAIKAKAGDRFTIKGQVLVAPTDFGRQVAVGIPTTVLLPFCDGDVSDLQGQLYVDQGAHIAAGDRSQKSSVMVMGANHNFFNTEWTPGVAKAPADDDVWGDDPLCGKDAKTRLSGKQQRAVGATYIAAAAKTYLTSNRSAAPLLDGTPVRARSAGKAVTLVHATGGNRRSIVRPKPGTTVKATKGAKAVVCEGGGRSGGQACDKTQSLSSPHWPSPVFDTTADPVHGVLISWNKVGGRVTFPDVPNLAGKKYLDLRLVVMPGRGTPDLSVVLKDAKGRTVTLRPEADAQRLPSGAWNHAWAQNVRYRLPASSKIDLATVENLTLKARSASGKVVLLDATGWKARPARTTANVRNVAFLDVPASTVVTATDDGEQTAKVRIPVRNSFASTAKVWIDVIDQQRGTASADSGLHTIRPGQKYVDVSVTYFGDDAYVDEEQGYLSGYSVVATAKRNAVVDGYVGMLSTRSTTPRPTLTVAQTDATAAPGGSLTWKAQLSGPVSQETYVVAHAKPVTGTPIRVGDLVPTWVMPRVWFYDASAPLADLDVYVEAVIPAGALTTVLEIPLRRTAKSGGTTRLELPQEGFVTAPITLTGKITG